MLGAALIGISFAGPIVRLSTSDPLAIATWRLFFSLLIVAGFLTATGEWRQWLTISRRELLLAALGGIFLALHFWAWNASVHLTTIAASVSLVALQPAFILAISALFLRELPNRPQMMGIAIAFIGATVIALPSVLGDTTVARDAMAGNSLALLAGAAAAAYYAIGRHLRASLGIWAYVGLVYFACFLTLVALVTVRGVPMYPLANREYGLFVALAIGPMLLGHTGMNWALKFMPAYVVNLLVLGEPIGATLIGALLPGIGEVPSAFTLIGGSIVLGGVVVAARASRTLLANTPRG